MKNEIIHSTENNVESDTNPNSPSGVGGYKLLFFDLAAAITFFTRLPIWKLVEIPAISYKRMIYFWSFTGWITSAVTALSFWLAIQVLPLSVAIIVALAVRVILTGGFHEDGLGDFFDGFGGGRTKADVLRIMKDSHAGSYSVLGLIFYYLLLVSTISAIPIHLIPWVILAADPLSKFITTVMMNLLPYARPESESKSKTIYEKLSWWKLCITFAAGISPLIIWLNDIYLLSILLPTGTMIFIYFLSKKKINGYTGDVCGATALLCELAFYLGFLISIHRQ